MQEYKLLKIQTKGCNTIEKEDKDTYCTTNRQHTHDAGSEQCYVNTGPERNCTRTNNSMYHYKNTVNNSDLHNTNAFRSMAKNNDIEYSSQALAKEVIEYHALK